MCGIVFSNSFFFQKEDLDVIKHRGPDFQNVINRDGFSFGHVRLSIQDLSVKGNQPYCDDNFVLLFNGEIYNCEYLIKRFNIECDGSSDTQVLFEGLKKIGKSFLNFVDGIYSIVFYDGEKLFLARDPAGVKGLYYIFNDGNLLVSSEIKFFNKFRILNVDPRMEHVYKSFRFVPSPFTAFIDVFKLKVGEFKEFCFIENKNAILSSIGKIQFQTDSRDYKTAIRSQLISDVSVSALISGGVDSSLISTVVKNVKYYHATNESGFKSELDTVFSNKYVKGRLAVIELNNVNLNLSLLDAVEEPVSANSVFFLNELMSNIDETVILAGQGGDELFFGYHRYRLALLFDFINYFKLNKFIPYFLNYRFLNILHDLFKSKSNIFRIAILLGGNPNSIKETKNYLFDYYPEFKDFDKISLLESIVFFDRTYSLPDELLMYTDKISMLYSKEVRVPLLSLSIPRRNPYSFVGLLNIFFPKISLRFLCINNGVFPSFKKIGFEYDSKISKHEFQNLFWNRVANNSIK